MCVYACEYVYMCVCTCTCVCVCVCVCVCIHQHQYQQCCALATPVLTDEAFGLAFLGLARTTHKHIYIYIYTYMWFWPRAATIYMRCIYGTYIRYINTVYIHGIFGRNMSRYTVIYGAYIRLWPTLSFSHKHGHHTHTHTHTY